MIRRLLGRGIVLVMLGVVELIRGVCGGMIFIRALVCIDGLRIRWMRRLRVFGVSFLSNFKIGTLLIAMLFCEYFLLGNGLLVKPSMDNSILMLLIFSCKIFKNNFFLNGVLRA